MRTSHWVLTNWKKTEIDNKLLEFRLPVQDGNVVRGIAKMSWIEHCDGRVGIEIEAKPREQRLGEETLIVISLKQEWVDCIERADSELSDFVCFPNILEASHE